MKKYGIFAILVFLLTGCFNFRDYMVESDYSYYGKFKKYKTFNFLNYTNPDVDTTMHNLLIEESIKSRLELQGYRLTNEEPNLIVSYKIFFDDFKFQGYNQPDIELWSKNENEEEDYDPVKYELRQGTLLILLWDNKREKAIWQGYASGLFGNPYANNERYLKRAVRSIFDRYRFFAEGYMVESRYN
ncbi:MAG: DUF4136 domain-containing protein [Candidatus Cyclobacteriaceae bacterium M3_2C_046]